MERSSCLLGLDSFKSNLTHCRFLFLQLDRERKIAGVFPRLVFKDKSTYVESSTKVYDDVSETDVNLCCWRRPVLTFCLLPLADGLQVPVMAALPFVRLLRRLQFVVRGAQRLVLMDTQHALRLLANLR